jgi:hypothetical protein
MNFNNFFSVCAMPLKFYGECPGILRLLRKIWFLLFDTFQCDLLIMQKSAFLACEFCVGSFLNNFSSNFYSSLLVGYKVSCNFCTIFLSSLHISLFSHIIN